MKHYLLVLIGLVFISQPIVAQFNEKPVMNLETEDEPLLNWGYFLGFNQYDFKFAEYTLHFQENENTQAQKALIIKHTSGVSIQEYAIMTDNNAIVSMGATIEDGTVKLQATPESGISGVTTYRFVRNTML